MLQTITDQLFCVHGGRTRNLGQEMAAQRGFVKCVMDAGKPYGVAKGNAVAALPDLVKAGEGVDAAFAAGQQYAATTNACALAAFGPQPAAKRR
jgi:hypothetical protein